MGFLAWIVVGLIAGWLAGQVMKGGGYGVLVDIILGILGGVLACWASGQGGMIGWIVWTKPNLSGGRRRHAAGSQVAANGFKSRRSESADNCSCQRLKDAFGALRPNHVTMRYAVSSYLVDFEVGRSFRGLQFGTMRKCPTWHISRVQQSMQ